MAIYTAILVPASDPTATSGKVKFIAAEGKGIARKQLQARYPDKIVTHLVRHEVNTSQKFTKN